MKKGIIYLLLLMLSIIISLWSMIEGWGLTIQNGWIVVASYAWLFISGFIQAILLKED